MASDKLIGNMPTEKLVSFVAENNLQSSINSDLFEKAYNNSLNIFERYK